MKPHEIVRPDVSNRCISLGADCAHTENEHGNGCGQNILSGLKPGRRFVWKLLDGKRAVERSPWTSPMALRD